jgi:hypothetical protein
MSTTTYSEPVTILLSYGDKFLREKQNHSYASAGINASHIPDLMRMVADEELNNAGIPDAYAPIHAAHALGELKAVEAIEVLLAQLYHIEEDDDDWINDEYPQVFSAIGAVCIPALASYIQNPEHYLSAAVCATESVALIGETYPESRLACINALVNKLEKFTENDETLNGFLVSALAGSLNAHEAIDLIRQAFKQNCVDISIHGDLEDIEITLGIRNKRATPKPDYMAKYKLDEVREALEKLVVAQICD